MAVPGENERSWGSRRMFIMVLLCQLISTPMFITLPNVAVNHGATGYMLCYLLGYFTFGIPLLYMEYIISQFTARDCIDVWKVRPCLSHIGYVLILWQVFLVVNNHITLSFTFHYLLISFESPVPYYTCGRWASKDCNTLRHNYSVNQDCIRLKDTIPYYCDSLYMSFPEFQYWKYNILGTKKRSFVIAWRVCLASALIGAVIYLGCFKRKKSVRLFVPFCTIYPVCGYLLLLMVSMLQKGVVVLYYQALDSDFQEFSKRFRLSLILMQVVNNLGLGSGLSFNLGLGASFRSPCYSNTVLVVMMCAACSMVAVCTTAMMACPYAFEYGINPMNIISAHMALIYEKIPRLLQEYEGNYFWVILIFSSLTVLNIGSNVIIIHHLLDILVARCVKVAKYPGLMTLLIIILLYFFTIPFLSSWGINITLGLRRFAGFVSTFTTLVETLVFIVWYGLDRFTEDVHFMQGIQPKTYMKLAWLSSNVILLYVFCYEIYAKIVEYNGTVIDKVGWIAFIFSMTLIVGICILKLSIATCRHKFKDVVCLDPTWGPRDEVLQRSRAMFTAQAMTKEYLYRQYHLQAGILSRQKMSNCRNQ